MRAAGSWGSRVGSRGMLGLVLLWTLGLAACGSSSSEGAQDVLAQDELSGDSQVEPGDVLQEIADRETLSETDEQDTADVEILPQPIEPHVETMEPFTILYLSGTPYEMGRQQGELLHDIVEEAVAFVEADVLLSSIPMIAEGMGIIDIARENSYPALLEECQGLVDATADVGFTMDLCLVLNFGDVMLEMVEVGVPESNLEGPGCSGAIVTGEATTDGRLLHSRNLDWGSMNVDIIHQNPVIFVRQPTDGIPHVYVGFPLNLSPYTGMSLAGLAIGSQEAEPASIAEMSATGRSHVQMVAELLRTANSLDEARTFINGEPHMSTETLVISDGNAQTGSVFEMTATGVGERPVEDGYAYATNHFVHPDMVDKHAVPSGGSLARFQRFGQLIDPDGEESLYGQLDLVNLARVMRDPIDPRIGEELPYADLEAAKWDIDGALGLNGPMHFVIFDPQRHLFWVNAGILPLHTHSYRCFSLEELLHLPDATPCEPATIE